ncbi:carboxypeptidase-like regulatory domain-containing protein [Yeosuana aromativorans]|nr:carboxypeptidase-like regulatory domain-containing protein [Yeosuana aromativorans]
MKKTVSFLIIVFLMASVRSQTVERVAVKGVILTTNTDIEGITVFNTSSNKGTVTNNKGEFNIAVALNDRIEVSALQFEPVVITIDDTVISSKELKIFLREHINNLDAVLLTFGLSGYLLQDIKNIKPPPSIDMDFGNMDAYMLSVDNAVDNQVIEDALNSVVNKNQLYNGVNFVEIFKLFSKHKKRAKNDDALQYELEQKELIDVYSQKYISERFHVPQDSVGAFVEFLKSNGMTQELLKPEHEMQLIEFVTEQSKLFLKKE